MTWSKSTLLTVDDMAAADAAAIESGISGHDLMEAAGRAVADHVQNAFPDGPVIVLCGPGNNGGDGYVAARYLLDQGRHVQVCSLVERAALRGDAGRAAAQYLGPWQGITGGREMVANAVAGGVIIDAMFGAGLTRPLQGHTGDLVDAANSSGLGIVAVDIPSGVMGNTGAVQGPAVRANLTVTFCRRKPGHCLMPGVDLCGPVIIADIGISDDIVDARNTVTWANSPEIWWPNFPHPGPADHKYSRGHVVVWGGQMMPGAARLAAAGARRLGAGMVTIATLADAVPVFHAATAGLLVRGCEKVDEYADFIANEKCHALLIGPGAGLSGETRDRVLAALRTGKPAVVDADGLSVFGDEPATLIASLHENCVLTPHEGEFSRLFRFSGDRLSRARQAAAKTAAIVVLKGYDTVIAAPDGRAIINTNGSPFLATAGTGDVLAGMIVSLLGQGMPPFLAAAAAVWLHSGAAGKKGHGLIAEDIPDLLPELIREMS